jgi:hypothetical protein
MATKKQKRLAGIAKREKFEREERERNARILEGVRENRRRQLKQEWEANHEKRHTDNDKLVDECPWCQDIKKAQRAEARQAAKVEA